MNQTCNDRLMSDKEHAVALLSILHSRAPVPKCKKTNILF